MGTETDFLARKLWSYERMNQKLEKADAILVLGSSDLRVASYAAQLFLDGWAPLVIFSGKEGTIKNTGQLTSKLWGKSEAERFAEVAMNAGVPKQNILIEDQSTNTSENILFTKKLLEEKRVVIHKFILVQKPYLERRVYATFEKRWPEKNFIITSPAISFEDYPYAVKPKEAVISALVGELQRIKLYAEKGFLVSQDIPEDIWNAYEKLVALGYTQNLVR